MKIYKKILLIFTLFLFTNNSFSDGGGRVLNGGDFPSIEDEICIYADTTQIYGRFDQLEAMLFCKPFEDRDRDFHECVILIRAIDIRDICFTRQFPF